MRDRLRPTASTFLVVLLIGAWCARPSEAQPESMTLDHAVQEALDHNLELIARRLDLSVADTRLISAALKPNPIATFQADHLDWLGTHFNDVNHGGPTELTWHVDVPIERGGKRELRMEEARADRDLAEAKVADQVRILTEQVQLAFIDLVSAQSSLAVARNTLRTLQDLATLNVQRVHAGAVPPYEATRTEVAMLQFRSTVNHAERAVVAATIHLRSLLGRPSTADPVSVVAPPMASLTVVAPESSQLEALAMDHRADVRASRLAEARGRADLQLQLALGKVDLIWGAEYRRQTVTAKSNSLGLSISAPVPIHNRNQGEIARSSAEADQARHQTAAVEATVRAEVRSAFEEFTSARDLLASIERDLLAPAQSARDTAAYAYRAGGTTLVELLDSQRAWNDTIQSYQDAQAEFRRAVVRLNSSVGTEVIQ